MERGAAGRDLDRNELQLHRRWNRGPGMPQPVVGRVEGPARGGVGPPVRTTYVVDRPGVSGRVVERHPAGGHVRRIEMVEVRGVLMAEQGLARRRLPDRVVLRQANTGEAGAG